MFLSDDSADMENAKAGNRLQAEDTGFLVSEVARADRGIIQFHAGQEI